MRTTRRTFLHQAAAAAGWHAAWQSGLLALSSASAPAALAAASGRKLALLVGIDYYPTPLPPLQGCGSDVQLQRELLVHRFGFDDNEIRVLKDAEATRDRIESAFLEHLVEQAGENDTVFFHFSGYGRLTRTGTPWQSQTASADAVLAPALVPVDSDLSDLPLDSAGFQPANDLPLETLYLLVQALKTANVSLVLDCGFSTSHLPAPGNFRLRSPDGSNSGSLPRFTLSEGALTFQQDLRSRYRISSTGAFDAARAEQCKGALIFAGSPPNTAAEADWGDYTAGLFTRALGRALAESPTAKSWQDAIARANAELRSLAPEFDWVTAEGRGTACEFAWAATVANSPLPAGSVGWVQALDGDRAALTLAGVSPILLPYLGVGTRFQTADGKTTLELKSRQGLTAKVEKVGSDSGASLKVGDAIVEVERVLPSNVELAVALCEHLERIEKVDTLGALSSVNLAGGFDFIDTHNPHEALADCMFGTIVDIDLASAPVGQSYPPKGSYGLFSPGGTPMWETFGVVDEAPKMAVQRLAPRLRHLLAAKRLRMTANDTTSQLALSVTLDNTTTSWKQSTLAAIASGSSLPASPLDSKTRLHPTAPIQVKVGDRLRCEIENVDERSLSVCVFSLDSMGTMSVLVPPPQVTTLASFPGRNAIDLDKWLQGQFVVRQPPGPSEFIVVASLNPLAATQQRITTVAQKMGVNHGFIALPKPLELVQLLLEDLSGTASGGKTALQTKRWVTLPARYTVV